MAGLPGRSEEWRLRRWILPLLVLCAAGRGAERPLTAQEEPDSGPSRVGVRLELGGGLSLLHGTVTPALGGAALVVLTPRLAVGGGGAVFPSETDLEGDLVFPDQALRFGYGGILVEVALREPGGDLDIALRSMVGAGNVDLHDRRAGTRLGSDNVVVLEPGVALWRPVVSNLDLGLFASWRAVLGLEDVQGIRAGDLAAPSLTLGLRLGPL